MKLPEDINPTEDVLKRATAALRESVKMEVPVDAVMRAETIARAKVERPRWRPYLKAVAACAAVVAIGIILLMSRGPGRMAFAEVAKAVGQTHTFTGKVDLVLPESQGAPPGMHFTFNLSMKDSSIRADSMPLSFVMNPTARKVLVLIPLVSDGISIDFGADWKVPDVYALVHDYQSGSEKALGEKTIDGRKLTGFQVVRPMSTEGQASEDWTFWVDPQTKLPVQIEFFGTGFEQPIVVKDLHFDVALDDKLFDMKLPVGYTLIDKKSFDTGDPWNGRKYSGQVFDERGVPIAGVEVTPCEKYEAANTFDPIGDPIKTDKEGRFSFDLGEASGSIGVGILGQVTRSDSARFDSIGLEFSHPDFLYGALEGIDLIPPEQRSNLRLRLRDGKSVSGWVVDGAGHPVAGAIVEAVYGKAADGRQVNTVRRNYDKKVLTDPAGKFELRGLSPSTMVVQVCRNDPGLPPIWGQAKVELYRADKPSPVEIVAKPIDLPLGKAVHTLFGMKLVELDDNLRDRLSLTPVDILLILDPGPNAARLGLGDIQQGDTFWEVENHRIKDFNDFAAFVLSRCKIEKMAAWTSYSVNVLYDARRSGPDKSYEARMRLTEEDVAELEKTVKP